MFGIAGYSVVKVILTIAAIDLIKLLGVFSTLLIAMSRRG